ncbi:MAG: RNA 2',3'-cyclic phosphodiesterase [Gallionella sp.]|nr:RNA 2',3'-cyclic phosphodiesterase [Gallionella sp.]
MTRMNTSSEQVRVFFALWPKSPERLALSAWQAEIQSLCGGQVMRADTLHTTLVFLGEIDRTRLEALKLAAQEVTFRPFELGFDAARYWGHNHIAYAAPTDVPPRLMRLVADLEQRLGRHRFHFERRPYKPHVTLLRHAKWTDEALPAMAAVHWQINEFVLVQSLQDEQGGHYEVLARFAASELE